MIESELKFLFAPQDLPKVKALPLLRDALPRADQQRLTASYFDTPDKYLWRRGLSLRIRRTKQGRVQTLKQEKSSALDRGEWEEETGQDVPDIDALSKTPLGHCLGKRRVRDRLRPNFEVDVERASVTLDVGRARIDVALDEGSIEAQGRTIAVDELELELKQGEKPALFDLARTFSQRAPISLSFISKAERGYLLNKGVWGQAFGSTQPKLAPDMSCVEAFEAVCRCCLHDFMLNMPALETSDRVEAVHKGRVSIRRLRAGLQLFEPLVCDEAYQRLDDDLKCARS